MPHTNLPPSHLLLNAGDKRTLCGKKERDGKEFYPHLLARFVGRFERGHASADKEFAVCMECRLIAIARGITLDVPDDYAHGEEILHADS